MNEPETQGSSTAHASGPPTEPEPSKAAFAFVFVTVALDMLALGVMIPVLPKLIIEFEGGDIAAAARMTGIFGFAWALMQFFFSPVLGTLSDKVGRRPIILLSNLGLGLDYVLMAIAPSIPWLFAGRLISGITAASHSTAGAYIADVTPPEKRAARYGLLGAAFGLGFVVGPAVGGFLGGISLRLPFWAAAGLSLLNAAYGFFVLPESLKKENRTAFSWSRANPLGALKLLRSNRAILVLALSCTLSFLAHESLPSMWVLYTDYRYKWDERTVGISLAAVGIGSMVVSGLLVGRLVKWLGEAGALAAGLAFGCVGMALFGFATNTALFLTGIPCIALFGITNPAFQSILSRQVGAGDQGQLQGALASLRGVTGMIGPLLFTQVFTLFIGTSRPFEFPGAPYALAAALLALSFALAFSALPKAKSATSMDKGAE